jgi:undecaprenyl pyrophosphate phosphatase UppP
MNQNWRDLIGGIFLVPLMHIGVFAFFQLIMTITHSYPLGLVMIISFYCIGITQLIYLIPIVRHYRKKQRWDVVKGITIGVIATIVITITSAHNRAMLSHLTNLPDIAVGAITISLMLIIFYAFNRRSSQDRSP